jgi:hypothetical protein
MKPIQVNKDRALGCKELEKDLGREGEKPNGERKWHGLILTADLNQQHLRMFTEGVNQIEQ